jgi:hypothetical protein
VCVCVCVCVCERERERDIDRHPSTHLQTPDILHIEACLPALNIGCLYTCICPPYWLYNCLNVFNLGYTGASLPVPNGLLTSVSVLYIGHINTYTCVLYISYTDACLHTAYIDYTHTHVTALYIDYIEIWQRWLDVLRIEQANKFNPYR